MSTMIETFPDIDIPIVIIVYLIFITIYIENSLRVWTPYDRRGFRGPQKNENHPTFSFPGPGWCSKEKHTVDQIMSNHLQQTLPKIWPFLFLWSFPSRWTHHLWQSIRRRHYPCLRFSGCGEKLWWKKVDPSRLYHDPSGSSTYITKNTHHRCLLNYPAPTRLSSIHMFFVLTQMDILFKKPCATLLCDGFTASQSWCLNKCILGNNVSFIIFIHPKVDSLSFDPLICNLSKDV